MAARRQHPLQKCSAQLRGCGCRFSGTHAVADQGIKARLLVAENRNVIAADRRRRIGIRCLIRKGRRKRAVRTCRNSASRVAYLYCRHGAKRHDDATVAVFEFRRHQARAAQPTQLDSKIVLPLQQALHPASTDDHTSLPSAAHNYALYQNAQ